MQIEGDHHFFIFYTSEGKKTGIKTKISHSSKVIGDSLMSMMAKQCKISKQDFLDLIDCSLTREGYEQNLKAAKHLE